MSESTVPENDVMNDEEVRALRATPPEIIVGNHAFHLMELAAIYLSSESPQLDEARLAIDAVSGMLNSLGDRLGDSGSLLHEGLAQIQMAYVRVSSS